MVKKIKYFPCNKIVGGLGKYLYSPERSPPDLRVDIVDLIIV